MSFKVIRFLSLLFVALTLGPSMAHLLELPNKIGLPADEYLIVQQIYRGWSLLGFVVAGALLSTIALTIMAYRKKRAFVPTFIALLLVIGSHLIFWLFTAPANQATGNWTFLPEHWEQVRMNWEYSHAAAAVLNISALIALILSVLSETKA